MKLLAGLGLRAALLAVLLIAGPKHEGAVYRALGVDR